MGIIDQDLKQQLEQVFAQIEGKIAFVYNASKSENQAELIEMLRDLLQTNKKFSMRESGQESVAPSFWLELDGQRTGVEFQGIPGGHEFTSLVVAILNTDKKGKLPDPSLQRRIRRLKGPIKIETMISLSCENCPDVVQALNQMALLHPNFHHVMKDGAYFQGEINQIGIQGVPSVLVNSKLIHSGKASFLDLLSKLEEIFGIQETPGDALAENLGHFDVVVVGGGPAGASAAIYSARKGLRTAVLAERVGGQVQDTKGIENLISVPYTEGPQLAAQMAKHMAQYPIRVFEHRRVEKIEKKDKLVLQLQGGDVLTSESLIVATGAKWRELGVPGEKEYIGRGVAFCPHCDGPYYKGKKVAVIGGGNSGVEAALDLAGIVREVVLFEFMDQLKADQVLVDKMKATSNISFVLNAKTDEVIGDGQKVLALDYTDRISNERKRVELDGVFVQIGLVPNSQFLKGLVEQNRFGEIIIDEKGRTSVTGIYAAGDVTTVPFKQIVVAMGEGAKAALAAFEDRMKAPK